MTNRDMADAHATARARDARVEESFEERAERYGLDWDVVAHLMSEQPTRRAYRTRTHAIDPETGEFTPLTQESDMTKHDRHDELVALLTEIRDRLPEPEGVKDEPEKTHPCPGCGTFTDKRVCNSCWGTSDDPGAGYSQAEAEREEPAPADDLPGEPVEPGDLRAGDRVAFTYDGERIACTLVSEQDGALLRSDTPNSRGFFPSVVSRGDAWIYVVTDVRLIERAPREDDDPDEALARHSDDANCEWAQYRKDYGVDPTVATHKAFHAGFKAAREHIEAEREEGGYNIRRAQRAIDRAEKAEADLADERDRHDATITERDALRERLDALRADMEVHRCSVLSESEALRWGVVLDRDERAAKGEQR